MTGYKTWIAGQLEPAGRLIVDAGAVGALMSGKSLLPAGVTLVSGDFARGDTVAILSPDGPRDRARAGRLRRRRCRTDRRPEDRRDRGRARLRRPRSAMIHRDDLVMTGVGEDERKRKDEPC